MARKSGSHANTTGHKVRKAAIRLIAKYGFAAVTMRQIANEVGVQVGALYRYTPNKQALLSDLLSDHFETLLAQRRGQMVEGTPADRLKAFCEHYIVYSLENPDLSYIAQMELRNLNGANTDKIESLRQSYEAELNAILQAGQGPEDFKLPDIDLAVSAIFGMLSGAIATGREGGGLPLERVTRISWNMVRRAVGA